MRKGKWMALPTGIWLILLFVVPISFIVWISFLQRGPYGEIKYSFTFANYMEVFDSLFMKVFIDTFAISILTTAFTLVMGYPIAYYISRMNRNWQHTWLLLIMIPFWINFLVRSYAWVIVLRSQGIINTLLMSWGWIDQPLQLLYNMPSVFVGMVYTLLPFMILPVYVSLEQMDRRKLEAAYDLGATPWKAFWHVTLPLTKTGIVTGSILVFISSIGMFVVPDVMGGAKSALIGNVIQNQFLSARDWPFGSALSIILVGFTLILIYLYYRALRVEHGRGGAA